MQDGGGGILGGVTDGPATGVDAAAPDDRDAGDRDGGREVGGPDAALDDDGSPSVGMQAGASGSAIEVLRPPGSGRPARRRLGARARAWLRAGRTRWRRSLLLRVVAATVALGLVVVLVVGQFLLQRITNGLVASRMTTAQEESKRGLDEVNQNFRKNNFQDPDLDFPWFVNDQINQLQGPAERPTRDIVLVHALSATEPTPIADRASSSRMEPTSIPLDLRDAVNVDATLQHARLLTLPVRADSGDLEMVRAIAVGGLVDFGPVYGGRYELYFVYRLDNEVQILARVQRTFIVGGVALLALVGAVAWVVTRQVVAPVRLAARTAEQLASGRLDRRMQVRGEDDIARLGRAFNEMAASLERQIHQLEELSRVQRRFVSDVSHELRTPLTTIRMAGEVMYEARASFPPEVARSSELLQTQLDRFESLLADLLEVSRFDAGAALLEIETADIREVVLRVVDGLRPLADRRGTRLVVRAPTATPAEFDHRRIERVVRNLVGNAIEHGEGRPVAVTVASDADAVAVTVRDHGVGLAPAEQRLVFNRFWRADPARARSTGGTGLGLAIALEDAHLHGGWLQVWGAPGMGANFRLTLPRRSGVVLNASPLPLVPLDVPSSARAGVTERAPVAVVVGTDGTAVVASDGAAAVLAEDPHAAVAPPPLRVFVGTDEDRTHPAPVSPASPASCGTPSGVTPGPPPTPPPVTPEGADGAAGSGRS
jgi:two-component system sensor histidine kinase MtrB